MGKFILAVLILLPQLAQAAPVCRSLFMEPSVPKYDFQSVDSTNMSSVDYLMLQHRRWQQRSGVEFYTKEQLLAFVERAKTGDSLATENLIVSNIPIIVREVSKKVSRYNPIYPELINESLIGMYDVIRRFRLDHPDASFLSAVKFMVKDVLKTKRKDEETIDYGIKAYNDIKNHVTPIRAEYEIREKRLTAEDLVREFQQRFNESISKEQAQNLLNESMYSVVRDNSEMPSGFSLSSLKQKTEFDQTTPLEISNAYRIIDQIKQGLETPEYKQVFELYYGLTKEGGLKGNEIAEKLSTNLPRIKWIIREKIKPAILNEIKNQDIDRGIFEQALVSYAVREQLTIKNSTAKTSKKTQQSSPLINTEQVLDGIYQRYLNNSPLLEVARSLRELEPHILKSQNSERIFEFQYLLTEVLMSAKKYDMAYKKANELLEMGRDWRENHQHYLMLHHTAGQAAYLVGNYKLAEVHLRKALVIKNAEYNTWFYYAKTVEQLYSNSSFESNFQRFILFMTTLHQINTTPIQHLSPRELDQFKTIEFLTEQGLKQTYNTLKSAHAFKALELQQVHQYTEARMKKDFNGIINALLPLYESLAQTPSKRLKKLNLEGPTSKAFNIYLSELAVSLKTVGRIKHSERVYQLMESL